MIRSVVGLVEQCWGVIVRLRTTVQVGPRTRIGWFRLGARAGELRVGSDSIVRCRVDFDHPGGVVTVGDRCYIGTSHLVCHTGIAIGNDVIISWGVTIVDHNSHSLEWERRERDVADWHLGQKNWTDVTVEPVRLGDRVWIGFGASILKGVLIGEGAVVGAQSVVTKDVPPYTVVAGNPARVVRSLAAPVAAL